MECPNCSFQNMPGQKRCGRCAGVLDLSQVDYLPTRASGGRRARAARDATTRAAIATNEQLTNVGAWFNELLRTRMDWRSVWLSLLPGLGHVRAGHRRFGYALMTTWFVLLLFAIGFAGGAAAWMFYLLAVGFHSFVITLLFAAALQDVPLLRRFAIGIAIYAGLNCLLYLPVRWASQQIAVPVQITGIQSTDLIRDGDTIVHTGAWLRPSSWQRGDLVFYRIDSRRAVDFNAILGRGYGLDRVVALGGDVVEVTGGKLRVNFEEVPSALLPLAGITCVGTNYRVQVPADSYLIAPSTLFAAGHGAGFEAQRRLLMQQISIVKADAIIGRVKWRLRPWSRIGAID